MNRIGPLLLILAIGSHLPALAQPGVYQANSHTLFYLPMDSPNPIAPEGCSVVGGPPIAPIADRFGNPNKAIHASATGSPFDYFTIECTNTKIGSSSTQDRTVGYWIRMSQFPDGGICSDGCGYRHLTILATNNNNLGCDKYLVTEINNVHGFPDACRGGASGTGGEILSSTSIIDGNWHNLLFVFDNTAKTLTLYLDGVQNVQGSLPDPPDIPGAFQFVAGAENGSFALNGDLDDMWIEDQAWTPAQIENYIGVPPPSSLGSTATTSQNGFTQEPIDTATGNYFLSRTDLTVPGKGLAFAFTGTYNSLDTYSGPLGAGWTHSYNIVLTTNSGSGVVSIKEADGHQDSYTPSGGGTYSPAIPGLFDTLVGNSDGTFTLTRKNQTKFNFSAAGKLTSIVDRNGNSQTLTYGSSGNMASSQCRNTLTRTQIS